MHAEKPSCYSKSVSLVLNHIHVIFLSTYYYLFERLNFSSFPCIAVLLGRNPAFRKIIGIQFINPNDRLLVNLCINIHSFGLIGLKNVEVNNEHNFMRKFFF